MSDEEDAALSSSLQGTAPSFGLGKTAVVVAMRKWCGVPSAGVGDHFDLSSSNISCLQPRRANGKNNSLISKFGSTSLVGLKKLYDLA